VFYVPFSALISLVVEWPEGHLSYKKMVLFRNGWRKRILGELAEPGSLGRWPINRSGISSTSFVGLITFPTEGDGRLCDHRRWYIGRYIGMFVNNFLAPIQVWLSPNMFGHTVGHRGRGD